MITRTTDEMRELNAKMVESDPDEQESRFVLIKKICPTLESNHDPNEMKF